MPNQHKPELIELLVNHDIISTANDDYVNVRNPARPEGFAEHFAQLLSRIPNIHSPNKPEFFSHFFLGSALTLPYTDLMSELTIEKIFFRIRKTNLKLAFKIQEQTGYQLKFFIVSTGKSAVSFTDQELSDIKAKTSDSNNLVAGVPNKIECHVLHILKDNGFKLQVLSQDINKKFNTLVKIANTEKTKAFREVGKADQNIQFGPLFDKLSSTKPEEVQAGFEEILKSLKTLYKLQAPVLDAFKSEAAYHGLIHGPFSLNYKYTNSLDCYSEQISGTGYTDFRVLSRHDSKGEVNSNPFSITLEIKDGGGAEVGISQLKENGYAYISPNVRTEEEKAIIAALDWSKEDNVQDLKVAIVDVHKVKESLVARLIDDTQSNKSAEDITKNIREQMKSLYYSLSIKHKDLRYVSGVLLGESLSLQDKAIESYIFDYAGTITGGAVTTLLYTNGNQGIVFSILEKTESSQQLELNTDDSSRTRYQAKKDTPDWCMLPVQSLDISDLVTVKIVINTQASSFDNTVGKKAGYIDSINIVKLRTDEMPSVHNGKFLPLQKLAVGDVLYSMFDNFVKVEDVDLPPKFKKMRLDAVAEHKKVDINYEFKRCLTELGKFINRESDVQAILHGLFIGHKYEGKDVRVFSEVSYGSGRGDLALFIQDKKDPKQEKVALFEIKKGSIGAYHSLFLDSKIQLLEYIKFLKSSTDSKEVSAISVIYDSSNKQVRLQQFNSKIDHTSHSSSAEQIQATNNKNYKQENKKIIITSAILSKMFAKGIFDFSKYNLDTMDYILLKNFLTRINPSTSQHQVACILNLSNQKDLIKNIEIVAEILKHDIWIYDLNLSNCNIQGSMHKLAKALIDKENLKVLETGTEEQKRFILQNKNIREFYLKKLDLYSTHLSNQDVEKFILALSNMHGLEELAISHISCTSMTEIALIINSIGTIKSLKFSDIHGFTYDAAELVSQAISANPGLESIDFSNNRMGQSGIDKILQASKNLRIKKLDFSNNRASAYEVINIESLTSFISLHKKTLEILKWADNGLRDQGLNDLSPSFKESNIRVLDLSYNQIKEINGDQLPKTLTVLTIQHNQITSFKAGELKHLSNLDTLDITYNTNLANVCDVIELAISAHTKHLGLSGINLRDDVHVTKLNSLIRTNEDLLSLLLPGCTIDDHGAKILFDNLELASNKIKKVDLSDNAIEIKDEKVISGRPTALYDETGFIIYTDHIEEVLLAKNKITNIGGKFLLNALQTRSEQQDAREQRGATTKIRIDLSENSLTDEFARDLASKLPLLEGLKSLKLRGNIFGTATKNQLVNALGTNGNTDITSLEIDGLAQDEKLRLDSYLIRNAYGKSSTLELKLNKDSQFEVVNCLNGGRSKRFINGCKISWDDVDAISKTKTRNKEKIVIDAEKFLKYSKQYASDIEKSKQLLSLANAIKSEDYGRIVGKHQEILDQVIKTGGYKQYIESDRINYLGYQALRDNNIMPKLKATLVNGIGRIQMGYGAYGTFVSCHQAGDRPGDTDSNLDCILGVTEIGYSFLSRTIEQKISSKIASHVVAHKILGVPLARNFADTIAKGAVEIGSAAFDIADIIRSSIVLSKCNDQAGSESECSEKEIRDNIASITFSGISVVSGIVLLAAGAGGVLSVGAGAVIFVVRMIYGGVSNVVEYSQKYHTTDAENWSIFWRTVLFQDMASDVNALSARQNNIDMVLDNAWQILQNASEEIVGISLGLGQEYSGYVNECVKNPSTDIQLYHFIRMSLYQTGIGIQLETPSDIKQFLLSLLPIRIPVPNPNNVQCTQHKRFDVKPAVSRIDMSHKDDNISLSRVQPHKIANAQFVCLPKITKEEYEKGLSKFNPEAVFKCDNAAVLLYKQRVAMKSTDHNQKQTVLHYLKDIIGGSFVGSLEYNNYFLIFGGNASIFAPSAPYNVFKLLQKDYSGKVHLSANSTNVVDLSGFESIQHVQVEYFHIIQLTMQMLVTIDGTTSYFDALEKGVAIRYVGGKKTLDNITCDVQTYNKQDNIDATIVIDSGGVIRNISGWHDLITNCRTVILSPNTVVEGVGGGYVIYVKKINNVIGLFNSIIKIPDGAEIIFEISLFEDCEIKYSPSDNNLNISIPLPEGGEYKISLSQYMQEDRTTNYVLMHKNGVRIIPSLENDNTSIKNFVLHKKIEEDFSASLAIHSYSHEIAYKNQKYKIFSVLTYKEDYTCIFGSIEDDLIIENDNMMLISGGEGRDQYTINNKNKDELYIYNYAKDLKLDFLTIPSIKDLNARIHIADIELYFASKRIYLHDYLLDKEYQHIVITDHELNTVIPLYEGSNKVSLQPFYYPLDSKKNVYVLSSDYISGVIGIHSKDIGFYKQGNNLLITDKSKPFGILSIILEDYYIKDARSTNITLHAYDDGEVVDIIDLNSIVLSHTDIHISNVYGELVQEYVVDLQEKSSFIEHNNELSGMIVLQNTLIDDLSVIHNHNNDLILHSNMSNDSLILKDWYVNTHRVAAFEFDTGVTPIRVWTSNDIPIRIDLNNQINTEILKIDSMLVKAVLSFITNYNKDVKRPACVFLEEEISKFGGSMQSVSDIKRSLKSADDISGKVLVLLVAKFANRMLLEDPNIRKEEIYEFADVCFGTVIGSTDIKDAIQLINDSIEYHDIESAVHSKKHLLQEIMLHLPFTVNDHEGHVIGHRRDTRDVSERTEDYYRIPYSVDQADSRSFLGSTYWFKEHIDNMTSGFTSTD